MSSRKIPEEICLEILIRLPVESILNFKSVCKPWYSLISNPSFTKFHLQQNKNNPSSCSLLLGLSSGDHHLMHSIGYDLLESSEEIDEDAADRIIWYPYKLDIQFVRIFGSCNGLVFLWLYDDRMNSLSRSFGYHGRYGRNGGSSCDSDSDNDRYGPHFGGSRSSKDDIDDEDFLCVWNPTTREYKNIPNSPNEYFHRHVCIYGLGYDSKKDDYKFVIGICSEKTGLSTLVEVYSLRSDSWKTIQTPYRFTNSQQKSGVLVNDDLHWLAKGERGVCVVYFDSGSDTPSFKEIPLPMVPNLEFISLGVLEGGCLCVVADNGDPVGLGRVEVWELKVYGVRDSWNKRYVIANETITKAAMDKKSGLRIIWSFKTGKLVFIDSGNVVLYDPKHGKTVERDLRLPYFTTEVNYLQSFVSLNSGMYVGKEGKNY